MNKKILHSDVQEFLRENAHRDPSGIALQKSPFAGVSAAELAQQLDGWQRSKRKLPLWQETPGIYFPPKLSLEQASSALTAQYKAELITIGSKVIDVTGGFGIDAYYLSSRASDVTHCERQPELSAIAAHNAKVLGTENLIFYTGDGINYVLSKQNDSYDYLYIDPARRLNQQKVFLLNDCDPNIVALQAELLEKVPNIIVKSAPLLDISAALAQLSHTKAIHVISVANECKELLFVLERGYTATPTIIAGAISASGAVDTFSFHPEEEQTAMAETSRPLAYLYEPDAALLKSGAYKLIAVRYGMRKLHQHTHLYTSDTYIPHFMGRSFKIDQVESYGDFKKRKGPIQGGVTTRNFPLKADVIRKKHRILESDKHYFFFTTDNDNHLIVINVSK